MRFDFNRTFRRYAIVDDARSRRAQVMRTMKTLLKNRDMANAIPQWPYLVFVSYEQLLQGMDVELLKTFLKTNSCITRLL